MITSSWQEIESDGSMMQMHVSVPEGSGPLGGIWPFSIKAA